MRGMSSYLKLISRSVLFGIVLFLLENIGLINWVKSILQGLF